VLDVHEQAARTLPTTTQDSHRDQVYVIGTEPHPWIGTYGFTYNTCTAFSCSGGTTMKTMTYSESRANYAATLDSVIDDREEVVITRAGREPVVIVALSEYETLQETAYLLRSPENARRLVSAIEDLEADRGIERGLSE
jgi:antitoxin YefM